MIDQEYENRLEVLETCCNDTQTQLLSMNDMLFNISGTISEIETALKVNKINSDYGLTYKPPTTPPPVTQPTCCGSGGVGGISYGNFSNCLHYVKQADLCPDAIYVDATPKLFKIDISNLNYLTEEDAPTATFPYDIHVKWNHSKDKFVKTYPDLTSDTYSFNLDNFYNNYYWADYEHQLEEPLIQHKQFDVAIGIAIAYYDTFTGEYDRNSIYDYKFVRGQHSIQHANQGDFGYTECDYYGYYPFDDSNAFTGNDARIPPTMYPYVSTVDLGLQEDVHHLWHVVGADFKFIGFTYNQHDTNPYRYNTYTGLYENPCDTCPNEGELVVRINQLDESVLFYDIYIFDKDTIYLKAFNIREVFPLQSNINVKPTSAFYYYARNNNLRVIYRDAFDEYTTETVELLNETGNFDYDGNPSSINPLNKVIPFTLITGGKVIADVISTIGFGMILYITDSNDVVLTTNSEYNYEWNHAKCTINLTAGDYKYKIASFDSNYQFTYNIEVTTNIPSIILNESSVIADVEKTFSINIPSNCLITIHLICPSYTEFVDIYLYDSNNNYITETERWEGYYHAIIENYPLNAGDYFIKIFNWDKYGATGIDYHLVSTIDTKVLVQAASGETITKYVNENINFEWDTGFSSWRPANDKHIGIVLRIDNRNPLAPTIIDETTLVNANDLEGYLNAVETGYGSYIHFYEFHHVLDLEDNTGYYVNDILYLGSNIADYFQYYW